MKNKTTSKIINWIGNVWLSVTGLLIATTLMHIFVRILIRGLNEAEIQEYISTVILFFIFLSPGFFVKWIARKIKP